VDFNGQIFDKMIVKGRGVKIQAKTLSLPDVQVGSIIEYKYVTRWDIASLSRTRWEVQSELPTRRAKFILKPYTEQGYSVNWINYFIPTDKRASEQKDGTIQLEMENIPAFEQEDFMPPKGELEMRVQFFYSVGRVEQVDEFWKRISKESYDYWNQFIGKRGGIERASAEITAGANTPEEKLRKIYVLVQQIRNLSYERDKSEAEEKREKLKENNHIEDVWKRGYGWRSEINALFVGLVRAAGMESSFVRISERDTYFFKKNLKLSSQLDGQVALVRVGDKDVFYDPATPFNPFGLLAWEKTAVQGIRLEKQGGTFISTPQPNGADATEQRTAALRLNEDGKREGKVRYMVNGYPAARRKRAALELDENGRNKDLEDDLKEELPSNAVVKLRNTTGWTSSDEPLVVEYDIEIPGFALTTGRRLLVPTGVFQANTRNPFDHEVRKHPVYFRYPFREIDDVTIELPPGYRIESVPVNKKIPAAFGSYEILRESKDSKLHIIRKFVMDGYFYNPEYYPTLRQFYVLTRGGDEEQAVLRAAPAGGN
jgi:hypothetical protein